MMRNILFNNAFYDEDILFNILTFSKTDPAHDRLITTQIYPQTKENIKSGLELAGFSTFHFYSDFDLSPFNEKQPKDLIVLAIKN